MVTNVTYLGSAGLGLLLVLIGMFLGFTDADIDHSGAGFDADGDVDLDGHGDGVGVGLSVLSMAGIGSILVGFGAVGYATSSLGAPTLLAVPVALAGSWACFRATAWVRRTLVTNLETGRSAGEQEFLYRPGIVTIPVPANRAGRGQVKVQLGDRWYYLSAQTGLGRELQAGESVVVTEKGDGIYLVDEFQVNA